MNPIKDQYENGECPDCGEDISDNVEEGEECPNCGHVFGFYMPEDESPFAEQQENADFEQVDEYFGGGNED